MNKSKIVAIVAVAIILWLVLSVSISLLLAVTAYCAKIMGDPATIACSVIIGVFVIVCCLMCSEKEDSHEEK